MKKFISIILAAAILFCLPCFACAGETVLTENKTYSLHFDADEEKLFEFTPTADGIYRISIDCSQENADALYIMSAAVSNDGEYINVGGIYYCGFYVPAASLIKKDCYFPAEKGKKVEINITNESRSKENFSSVAADIDVVIQRQEVQTLATDKTYTSDSQSYVLFASPEKDETYIITEKQNTCTVSYISSDGDGDYLYYCPEATVNEFVFKLEKGKKYLVAVSGYSDDEGISFSTKDGSGITPKEIFLEGGYMTVGEENGLYFDCSPSGSEINSTGFTVTVDNEKTAQVYWSDEYDCYLIKGLRPGTVTVTVTDNTTGISGEGEYTFIYEIQNDFLFSGRIFSFLIKIMTKIRDFFEKISIF